MMLRVIQILAPVTLARGCAVVQISGFPCTTHAEWFGTHETSIPNQYFYSDSMQTADRRPYYNSEVGQWWIYYDGSCGGSFSGWFLSTAEPSTTASGSLSGLPDSWGCTTAAYVTDSSMTFPESSVDTVYCDDVGWTSTYAGAAVSVAGTIEPSVRITGFPCPSDPTSPNQDFDFAGYTLDDRPYYKSSDGNWWIYYDNSCGGEQMGWFLSSDQPYTDRDGNLGMSGDSGSCNNVLWSGTTDALRISGVYTATSVYCSDVGWTSTYGGSAVSVSVESLCPEPAPTAAPTGIALSSASRGVISLGALVLLVGAVAAPLV